MGPRPTPTVLRTVREVRQWRRAMQALDGPDTRLGFVPTMGALHDGHLSLMRQSLHENARTLVSIFVNPTQFSPHEDLDKYPQTLQSDLDKISRLTAAQQAASRAVDAVFVPTVEQMYPRGYDAAAKMPQTTFVTVEGLSHMVSLPGTRRPTC